MKLLSFVVIALCAAAVLSTHAKYHKKIAKGGKNFRHDHGKGDLLEKHPKTKVLEGSSSVDYCYDYPTAIAEPCPVDYMLDVVEPCTDDLMMEVCPVKEDTFTYPCYGIEAKEAAYDCYELQDKKFCTDVPVEVPQTCTFTVQKQRPIDVLRWEEYFDCKEDTVDVATLCYTNAMENVDYTCKAVEWQDICRDVPEDYMDYCPEMAQREEKYSCPRTEIVEDCRPEKVEYMGTCSRKAVREYEEACTEKDFQRVCEMKPKQKHSKCPEMKTKIEKVHCTRKESQRKCKKVPFNVPKVCERTVYDNVEYPCEKPQLVCDLEGAKHEKKEKASHHGYKEKSHDKKHISDATHGHDLLIDDAAGHHGVVGHKGVYDDVHGAKHRELTHKMMGHGHKGENCREVMMPGTCVDRVPRAESYDCSRTEYQDDCYDEIVDVPDLCDEEVTKEVMVPCLIDVVEEKCKWRHVDVPTTCRRKEHYNEEYECTKYRMEDRCRDVERLVPDTCTRIIDYETKVPCPQTRIIEQCTKECVVIDEVCTAQVMTTREDTCMDRSSTVDCQVMRRELPDVDYEDYEDIVEYNCPQVTMEQQCQIFAVPELTACTKVVHEAVDKECTDFVKTRTCRIDTFAADKYCVSPIDITKPYDCYTTNYDEICKTEKCYTEKHHEKHGKHGKHWKGRNGGLKGLKHKLY